MEGNIEIYEKEGYVWVSINPKIYSLDLVCSTAYLFTDDCYVLIEGDPDEEIIVELRPKKEKDLKALGGEFNNELLKYAAYAANSTRNAKIRELILKRALLLNNTDIQTL